MNRWSRGCRMRPATDQVGEASYKYPYIGEVTLRRGLQFARIMTILTAVLGFRAYPARAQHAASPFGVSTSSLARAALPQASAPHTATIGAGVAGNRQSFLASSRHNSPILASGSKLPPTNHRRPGKPVRATGFYWIFDGGAYWVPAEGDPAADQPLVDQANVDQVSGGQSVDSGQSGSQGVSASMAQGPAEPTQSAREDAAASQSVVQEEASLPDEGQFTLVLNDGSRIDAVAFTHSNDTIVYITTDGGRRTIAANEVDSDSTLRVNQERGTPLQSPL
jgi:hypothetical protein